MNKNKFGKCPWCECENTELYFSVGIIKGVLWTKWICEACRDMRKMEEKRYA